MNDVHGVSSLGQTPRDCWRCSHVCLTDVFENKYRNKKVADKKIKLKRVQSDICVQLTQWQQIVGTKMKKKEKKNQRRTGKQRITPTVFPRVSLFERFFLFSLRFQIFLDLHPFFVDFTLLHLKKYF